ncbi:PAS domain-containing sensor histidine kinase [Lacisediminimonas sp.]|uniref:hybrid sensor histidine kinase/response regulator n=1 Tax=Lacisediminimonas sp. TaxID=3060582 RepID=UPI002722165B|nr:PAS domain S-box protein [Lacisediminimonas sp.]MDO8298420.1 PAS domain S-box protein [Lacisediminimonas sp.]
MSELKSAQDARLLLAAIVQSSDAAIIGKTLDGIITSWNPGAEKIFGYAAAQAIGRPMLMVFPPEGAGEEAEILERIRRGEHVQDFETVRIRKDGKRIHVAVSISPVADSDGNIVGASTIARDITEQRMARDQLERSVSLLGIAGQMAHLGGWSIELPAQTLSWSDEVCAIHEVPPGYTPTLEEAITFYPPEYRDEISERVQACLSNGHPFDLELQIVTARGARVWVRAMGRAVADRDGTIVRVQGAFQDISAQKAATEEIRGLGSRLFDTLESITDAVFTLDRNWIFTYLNPEAERLLERKRGELLGRNVWEEFADAEGTNFQHNYQRAVAQNVMVSFEEFYPRLDKWFDVRAFPSHTGLAVYFRDVTEQRKSREALRTSEERFRLLSQATNDAIWDWDLVSGALWWNEGFETLFGFRRTAVEPGVESWSSRIHPDSQERVLAGRRRAIDSGSENWTDTYQFRCHDGRYAQVIDRGHVIRDASGQAMRMVGGMSDITERLALEDRLRQSQRLDSIGQLTGGVAHDFNNLLTVILGNAELLTAQIAPHSRQHALAKWILEAAQRGADLTQRLLAFARKQALNPKITDVNRLVADLDRLLKRTLGEHIEIEIVADAASWPALVDPVQLENALLNLCLNARDAMPLGGRLTMETCNTHIDEDYASKHEEVTAGQYVMLAVSDTGTGIAPEHLARVFEPFFTTKEKGKGTGLGLAMVYGFIKQTGGHASIYSEPGQGTSVKLYLPRASGAAEVAAPAYAERQLAGGSETILLVEDDEFVRRYAQIQLSTLGYTVLTAENGHRALDLMRGPHAIDLLFTDVVMPGMSGRELADEARKLRPGIKVLYTSGYTENAIVHHGRLDPGVLLLGKPYRRAELAGKIREALMAG